jgi:hypothetical protein
LIESYYNNDWFFKYLPAKYFAFSLTLIFLVQMERKQPARNMENKAKIYFEINKSERGAALVMVLMVSSLLLIACIGMMTAAALNTRNVTDAVAEDQAYYAAESGLQSTINVLRGNTLPNPLFSATPTDPANKISFTKAVKPSTSNTAADSSAAARLSRWLNYNYTPSGASAPDRVVLGTTAASYNPNTGLAYSVEASDPDNTQNSVTFSTTGTFIPYDTEGDVISGTISSDGKSVTYGSGLNTTTLTFIGQPSTNLDVSSGVADTTLGYFKVSKTGIGATITDALRFQIAYMMSVPHAAARYIRGTITQQTGTLPTTAKIDIDSDLFFLMGSNITLTPATSGSYSKALALPLLTTSENTTLTASVTPAEPLRLLLKATGYGPRGARKQLEAVIQKNFFNDLAAPAALTLVGPSTGFVFNPGTSANVTYSGQDEVSNAAIPSIGVTNSTNLQKVLKTPIKTDPDPPASDVSLEVPDWLSSTYNLDATIDDLRTVAKASGRYYTSGTTPPNFGSSNGTGITFVDGNVSLSGTGGGILVCTGKLTLDGNVNFTGLIIVTGSGGMDRNGGGNGSLAGNTVIAPYNPSNLAAGFLAPKYDISGGGTSSLDYNSHSVANGLVAISNFVLGVAEK